MKCFEGIDNIFFDFDGTLCASEPDIKKAWFAAFAELGLEVPHFESAYRTGPPADVTARAFFPDADAVFVSRLCEVFWRCERDSDYAGSLPYPGVDAMLTRLRAEGKKLFLATNKTEAPTLRLLAKLGWERTFDALLTRSQLRPGETDKSCLIRRALAEFRLDPRRSAIVGDAATDVAAGRAAGIATIAATYGYGSMEELAGSGADRMLSLEEVKGYL